MKKSITILCILIITISFVSCSKKSDGPFDREDFLMGTIITQRIYGDNGEEVGNKVVERIKEIENKMTINEIGGEINILNELSGVDKVKLSDDTFEVIKRGLKYSQLASGAFDITIGPLVKAWGVFTDHPRVPDEEEIKNLLRLVNYKDIYIDDNSKTVMLAKQNQIVDLGGIAKGYAGDEAIRIYKENNIKSAFVNLGGNVVALGSKPDGSDWNVGIQNPRDVNGKHIAVVKVNNKAIVTSGDYERFFEKNGIRYHHIIDPKTGYPADSGLISATIISDASIDADALSTAVFVLGLEKGLSLIEGLDGIETILITKDKKIYTSSGLKDNFILDDVSKEYEYVEKR